MTVQIQFKPELLEKYGLTGPRYTSYPTAVSFHEGFDELAYRMFAADSNEDLIPRPLSLYVHLPFCQTLCYYCACNKKVTRHTHQAETYLDYLFKEIDMQGQLFDTDREVIQLHFGGGTPTYYSDEQLKLLMRHLSANFNFSTQSSREFSIEIDPRTVDKTRLHALAAMGFNRLSLGVQDFNPAVQKAVNRIQDERETLDLIDAARDYGFGSVSIDLIYGLPLQTAESFMQTIESVLTARPDRISVYNYAHLPHLFRAQRLISSEDVPVPAVRLELLDQTIEKLTSAGYEYIGMDHFALPEDELSIARAEGTLHRNFQGYSTCAECDLLGVGVSAISKVGASYSQNQKDIRSWQAEIETGHLPVWRGIQLDTEDRIRRSVIETIMCQGRVSIPEIEKRYDIQFDDYFSVELQKLEKLEVDGLLKINEYSLDVTPTGMLLLRVIAMVFDEHIFDKTGPVGFSKVI